MFSIVESLIFIVFPIVFITTDAVGMIKEYKSIQKDLDEAKEI